MKTNSSQPEQATPAVSPTQPTASTKRVVLSTSALVLSADGFIQERGVTVISWPETVTTCEIISIGEGQHRADDLIVTVDRITSKIAGWEVAL